MPQSDMLLEDLQGKTTRELQEIAANLLAECHDHRFDAHKQAEKIVGLEAKIAWLEAGDSNIPLTHTSTGKKLTPLMRVLVDSPKQQSIPVYTVDDPMTPLDCIAVMVGNDTGTWAYLPIGTDVEATIKADIALMNTGTFKEDNSIRMSWESGFLWSLGYGDDVVINE